MRLGIIARCDSRGIAYQTLEACRGLNPDRTLVVLMNDRHWPEQPERFRPWNPIYVDSDMNTRQLPMDKVRKFLDGLDVVFSVETLYDWEMRDLADELGVRLVVQGNPEFYTHHRFPQRQHPHQWVWPTHWMLDHEDMPAQVGVLPVPAPESPVDWETQPATDSDGPLRILHVAGHRALGDRNGTDLFFETIGLLSPNVHVTVVGQDGQLPDYRKARGVTVEATGRGYADRWDLYRNQHLIVLPRRYGGLCLPAIEAAASGVAIMMTGAEENLGWPIVPLAPRQGRLQRVPFGRVPTHSVRPNLIASEIDKLNRNRERLTAAVMRSQDWALDNNWEAWEPAYRDVLAG